VGEREARKGMGLSNLKDSDGFSGIFKHLDEVGQRTSSHHGRDLFSDAQIGLKELFKSLDPELEHLYDGVREKLVGEVKNWARSSEEKIGEFKRTAEESFQKSPGIWVAGAAAVGFFIGVLFARRR